MKKLKNNLYLFLSVLIFSCNHSPGSTDIERISASPAEIISTDLSSMMPGGIYFTENYLLWTDPFSDKFVHILDKTSGEELEKVVDIGEGPDEFISPTIVVLPENRIYIFNSYTGKEGEQSLEAAVRGENPVIYTRPAEMGDVTSMAYIGNDQFITFNPSKSQPFSIRDKEGSKSFGKLPFKGDIVNGINHFQGHISYNPEKEIVVYTPIMFPYEAKRCTTP